MITVTYAGKECHFDDSNYNPTKPGLIMGRLLRNTFYEAGFLKHIRSLNVRGPYVDIGAHIGNHTIFFAVVCEAERVHAFEPQARAYSELQRNVEINRQQDRVTTYNFALSDRDGEVITHFADCEFRFPGQRLDGVLRGPVSLIKIDVEGMEVPVLEGARGTLRRWRPVVFAEASTNEEYKALEACMQRHDYRPTHRVFNATPTYEFMPEECMPPGQRRRWFVGRIVRRVRRAKGVLGRARRLVAP